MKIAARMWADSETKYVEGFYRTDGNCNPVLVRQRTSAEVPEDRPSRPEQARTRTRSAVISSTQRKASDSPEKAINSCTLSAVAVEMQDGAQILGVTNTTRWEYDYQYITDGEVQGRSWAFPGWEFNGDIDVGGTVDDSGKYGYTLARQQFYCENHGLYCPGTRAYPVGMYVVFQIDYQGGCVADPQHWGTLPPGIEFGIATYVSSD